MLIDFALEVPDIKGDKEARALLKQQTVLLLHEHATRLAVSDQSNMCTTGCIDYGRAVGIVRWTVRGEI